MKTPLWLRIFWGLLSVAALTLALGTFSVVGVLLHARLPAGRALTAQLLTGFLTDYFQGSVRVSRISQLGLRGLSAERVEVHDTYGNRVLVLSGLRARASLRDIAKKLLSDEPKISLVIHHVRLEHGEVQIVVDPKSGIPTIADALTPTPTPDTGPSTRQVRVWLPVIEVGEAFGRGQVAEGTPTLEADVSTIRGSVLVAPKGVAVDVARFALRLRGVGGADAKGVGSLHVRSPGPVWGFFNGHFGNVQADAFVRYDEEKLLVRLDLPRAEPEDVRALFKDYPLERPAQLHAELEGPVQHLATKLALQVDDAKLTAEGLLSLGANTGLELEADIQDADLRALWPSAPESSIDARASVAIWPDQGQLRVDFNGYAEPSVIGGHEVPAIDVHGSYDELGLTSRATLHEPGIAAKLSFDINPTGVIALTLDASRFRLEHPRLSRYFEARGLAEGRLQARIEEQAVEGSFSADVEHFRMAEVGLAQAKVQGKFEGRLDRLEDLDVRAELVGKGFSREELGFQTVRARTSGPVSRPRLEATLMSPGGQKLEASGKLSSEPGWALQGLQLEVTHHGQKVSVKAARIQSDAGRLTIEKLRVNDGDSELLGDVRVRPGGIEFRAKGQSVDLEVLSKAFGLGPGRLRGRLTIDADVEATDEMQEGYLDVRFEDLSVDAVEGLSGQAYLQLDDGRLIGQGELGISGLGSMGASVDVRPDGRVDELASWQRATGSARFEVYAIDLSYFTKYLDESWGIQAVQGLASARVRMERERAEGPPSMMFDAQTQSLMLELASDRGPKSPTIVSGIDLQLGGSFDGQTGSTSGSVRAIDGKGPLLSASLAAELDSEAIWQRPETLLSSLRDTPFETVCVVPRRKLDELPALIRPAGVEGVISGRVSLSGTPAAPVVGALVDVEQLRGSATALSDPIQLSSRLHYTTATSRFGGSIEAERRGQRLLWGSFSGNAPLENLLAEHSEKPRWTGGGTFSVENLPLELLQPLSRARVSGKLNGIVALSRRGRYPDFNAQLTLEQGYVQGIALGEGQLSARAVGESVSADARFADAGGQLTLALNSRLDWDQPRAGLGEQPIVIDFKSQGYDAVLFLPFVEELFSELSGSLDAELHAELFKLPASETAPDAERRWDGRFRGHARLSDGVLQPSALGLELRETSLELSATREQGFNVIELEELSASARSDRLNLRGRGKLYFKGTELSHGWAGAGVDDVPFVVGGVRLADLTGQVSASFRRDPDRMSSVVDIPNLRASLPRSTGRSLIDLAPNPDINVQQPLGKPEADEGPALPWYVQVNLGDEVRVQSAVINLQVTGEPRLVLAEELQIDGKLVLPPGGRVTVAGKLFVIETGFLQFDTDEFSNPHLNVRAVWQAPNGIRVTATLSGTAREPQLLLESDPPLPGGEAQIYALLFGGGTGESDSNAASPALGAGATFLSEVLGNTPLRGVELRAGVEKDSGRGQTAQLAEEEWRSYAASVPISDDVWFEGSYKTEQRSTAVEGRSGFAGTIDWRFKQNWALRTELGELGTGVDLLWHYRY